MGSPFVRRWEREQFPVPHPYPEWLPKECREIASEGMRIRFLASAMDMPCDLPPWASVYSSVK